MPFECYRIIRKQRVDQTKQLHNSLILPKIFMAFQKEHKLGTIASYNNNNEVQFKLLYGIFKTFVN